MAKLWFLILVAFFATNSLEKAKSVKIKSEETPLKTFDEIFGEGWWDKGEGDDLKTPAPTNFGQNVHPKIDRQNTQIGQIEHNSTDQNPPLTEYQNIAEDERRRKIIDKFHIIKEELKQKGKFSKKETTQIEDKIAKHLKVNRSKIYKWKKEFGLSRKRHNFGKEKNDRKNLIEKFDQRKADLKRDGFKSSYANQINEIVAKELGLGLRTIYAWKRELGQSKPTHKYSDSEQKELIKRYYEIKGKNLKISDKEITKWLNINGVTLFRWKKQFKLQQLHPNSVDGHLVEENFGTNIQEIKNSEFGEHLNETIRR